MSCEDARPGKPSLGDDARCGKPSFGENDTRCAAPHETDCSEVLAEMWLYLDHECECERRERLRKHLDECSPCLARYGLEEQLKELLARKCGGEAAPEKLRQRLRDCIRTVTLHQAEVIVEHDAEGTTVEVRMREAGPM